MKPGPGGGPSVASWSVDAGLGLVAPSEGLGPGRDTNDSRVALQVVDAGAGLLAGAAGKLRPRLGGELKLPKEGSMDGVVGGWCRAERFEEMDGWKLTETGDEVVGG